MYLYIYIHAYIHIHIIFIYIYIYTHIYIIYILYVYFVKMVCSHTFSHNYTHNHIHIGMYLLYLSFYLFTCLSNSVCVGMHTHTGCSWYCECIRPAPYYPETIRKVQTLHAFVVVVCWIGLQSDAPKFVGSCRRHEAQHKGFLPGCSRGILFLYLQYLVVICRNTSSSKQEARRWR